MSDAEAYERAMHGETEGDELAPSRATAATASYDTAFHPGSLESLVRDVSGDNEERELQRDQTMRDLIGDVIMHSSSATFGEHAMRDWANMSAFDRTPIRKGEDDEKSSAFPFKFMIQDVPNKASRILGEIERSLGDGKGTVMMIIRSSASVKGMYEISSTILNTDACKPLQAVE